MKLEYLPQGPSNSGLIRLYEYEQEDVRALRQPWELLRFHSKLERSSDEVENVKDDRPIGPASERSTFWPRI